MSKVAVVYWSGTGNTAAMADAVVEGAKSAGADATLYEAADFNSSVASEYDGIAFGCPSMGADVLEEMEFQPMWDEVKDNISDKKVALFGSWGWSGGTWMDNWEEDAAECGITLACDSVICMEYPDDETLEACAKLGEAVAQ